MNNNVSVIIPTAGTRWSIFSSIASVKSQIFDGKVEIIVVLNGLNADKTILMMLENLRGIKFLICSKPNANAARHLGVENSDFETICFLDDDDLWVPNKLKLQIFKMRDEEADFSYTGRLVKSPLRNYYTISKPQSLNLEEEIFENNFVGGFSSIAISKDLYFLAGGVDKELGCFQDYEFYLRCLDKTKSIAIIDKPVVIYSQHFGVKISNNYIKNKLSVEQILLKYKHHFYVQSIKKSLKRMVLRKGLKYVNFKMIFYSLFV